ncbi:IucA/IucC family protein [Streptomyces sp. NPDC015242]|uniref:IucA/IucC family protein n=1 Tax=Streptomyces sp. NPDC015242 TaxID=3364951 RepID=UPI0036F7EB44
MLKLSLGLRITNSRRANLRKELHRGPQVHRLLQALHRGPEVHRLLQALHRGPQVHRLLQAGLAAAWRAAHPGFDIARDPARVGLDASGLPDPTGLDTVLRRQPFGPGDRVHCVAGLVGEQPLGDTPGSAPAHVPARPGGPHRPAGARCRRRNGCGATSTRWCFPSCGSTARAASPWRPISRTPWSC